MLLERVVDKKAEEEGAEFRERQGTAWWCQIFAWRIVSSLVQARLGSSLQRCEHTAALSLYQPPQPSSSCPSSPLTRTSDAVSLQISVRKEESALVLPQLRTIPCRLPSSSERANMSIGINQTTAPGEGRVYVNAVVLISRRKLSRVFNHPLDGATRM